MVAVISMVMVTVISMVMVTVGLVRCVGLADCRTPRILAA
jgi:hypothetical protein